MFGLSRTRQLRVIVLAVMIPLAVGACGSGSAVGQARTSALPTPTVTSTPTATPIPNITFNSPSGLWTLTYPGSWQAMGGDAGNALFSSPDRQDELNLLANLTPAHWTDAQYSSFFSQFLGVFGMSQITINSQSAMMTLGANTWTTFSATGTYKGTPYAATCFGLSHGTTTFLAIATSSSADATSAATTYFQPMVTSLTFLK